MIITENNIETYTSKMSLLSSNQSPPKKCIELFEKESEVLLKKGEKLFSDGSKPRYIYLVIEGIVKLYSVDKDKTILENYFQKGEIVNCEVIFQKNMKNKIAEAMTHKTAIKKIPIRTFLQSLKNNTPLNNDLAQVFSISLSRVQNRLRNLVLLSSEQRIYQFLAVHFEKNGRRVAHEYVIQPPLTQQAIGEIAIAGRQTVSTLLNELRRKRIIHYNNRYMIVRDISQLRILGGI